MAQNVKQYGLLFMLLLAIPTLACGLAEATPTAAPPTPTGTPSPTATSEPQVSFVDRDVSVLGLAFRYPDSWEIEIDESSVVVASDVELLSAQEFDREGAGALIVVGGADTFAGDTLEDSLNAAIQQFDFTENNRVVEGPRQTTIGGQEAVTATIEGSNLDGSQTLIVLVTLLRNQDRMAFIAGVTLLSIIEQYRETLDTVAQSVVLRQLETTGESQSQGVLRYGDAVDGQIESGRSASWTFIGVEGERIDLTVRPLQDDLDVSVDIQNAQGVSILPSAPVDDSFGVETIRGLVLPASAEYTVLVSGFAQASGTFEVAIGEAGALTSAQSIAAGETLNGTLGQDEQDDYLFSSEQQEAVTIVVNPVGDLDVVLEVLDGDGAVIYQEDSSYGQEQLSFTPQPAGSYILRVRGFAGASGDYAITVQAGGVGSTGTTFVTTGTLDPGDAEGHDFPFSADQGEVVQAIVIPDGDFDVVVEVWNDDIDEMEESIDASFGREQVNFTARQTGNYYFKVLGFEGQGGSFTITLSGPPTVIFELAAGDQVTGDLGQNSFIDYYVRLETNDEISIDVQPDGDTDIVAEVLDLDENVLSSADEGFAGEVEQLAFSAPTSSSEAGLYILRIRNFSDEAGGTFSLNLE